MFYFGELVPPPAIHVVEVGSMDIGDADPFARLSERASLSITGFEPQQAECAKLNGQGKRGRRYLPYVIGDGTTRNFYVTNTGMTSSLFEPDLELAARFRGLAEYKQIVSVETVHTVRLDEVAELRDSRCDMLKMDVQGAEAEILAAGNRVLGECVLVQTEVEFVPLYKQQPLFADVDQLLRKQGFMFHRFLNISGRTYRPLLMNNDPHATLSQQLWSDVVYVPDLRRLSKLSPDSLLKLAALLHEVYGSVDLCLVVLNEYDVICGTAYANTYSELLRRQVQENAAAARPG